MIPTGNKIIKQLLIFFFLVFLIYIKNPLQDGKKFIILMWPVFVFS